MNGLRGLFLCASMLLLVAAAADQGGLAGIRSLVEKERYAQALEHLADYRSANPDEPQARFLEGLILVKQGRGDKAVNIFKAIAQDYPELPEPHNNLAVLYAANGQYEKARDSLLEAIRTHPSYATAHENLGDIYAKMAALAYDKALELDEENPLAKAKLAMINELFSMYRGQGKVGLPTPKAAGPREEEKPVPVQKELVVAAGGEEPAEARVIATLQAWAAAWSAKDIDAYLRYYAANFLPQRGMSRSAWQAQRRKRLNKPRYIEVKIIDPKVSLEGQGKARVTFTQTYRSNTYSDRSRKTLLLARFGSDWKILREESLH